MQLVYAAGRQLLKLRLLLWGSAALLAVCLWRGVGLFQSYGLRPADGGVLAPPTVRAAWGIGVAVLGVSAFAGMWLYGTRYVAAIRADPDSDAVEIDTLGLFGTRTMRVPASSVHVGRHHAGYLRTMRATVRAPWTSLRVDGLRRRLILDDQGHVLDQAFPNRLREAAREAVRSRR